MKNLIIHPEVQRDLDEARRHYHEIDPELAGRMLNEVYARIA